MRWVKFNKVYLSKKKVLELGSIPDQSLFRILTTPHMQVIFIVREKDVTY
jgi:hypothetical protein